MENHKQILKKFEGDGFYIAKNIVKENQTCQIRFLNSVSNEFAAFRPSITHNPYAMKKLGRKIYD